MFKRAGVFLFYLILTTLIFLIISIENTYFIKVVLLLIVGFPWGLLTIGIGIYFYGLLFSSNY